MAMCAKNPGKAKAKCPPKQVAEEFVEADKGTKVAKKGS